MSGYQLLFGQQPFQQEEHSSQMPVCRPDPSFLRGTPMASAGESNQERIRALNLMAMMSPSSDDSQEVSQSIVQPQEPEERKVRVKSGDTLYQIAEREMGNGGAYRELAKHNNIQNPNLISVGQVLRIPKSSKTVTQKNSSQSPASQKSKKSANSLADNPLFQAISEFSDRISSADRSINPARNQDGTARTDWAGWCAATMSWFVQDKYQNGIGKGYGNGTGKSGSANEAREMSGLKKEIQKDPSHQDAKKAPKGAFHWWSGGRYGHVGLDVSGGGEHIFMATNMSGQQSITVGKKNSHLKVVALEKYNQSHPQYHYEGWTTNYCGAKVDSELLKTQKDID